MRGNVAVQHFVGDLKLVALDDDVPHAPDKVAVGLEGGPEPPRPGVAAQEQRVVGVCRADPGHADPGLGKDLVDRERHHVLGLHGWKVKSMTVQPPYGLMAFNLIYFYLYVQKPRKDQTSFQV